MDRLAGVDHLHRGRSTDPELLDADPRIVDGHGRERNDVLQLQRRHDAHRHLPLRGADGEHLVPRGRTPDRYLLELLARRADVHPDDPYLTVADVPRNQSVTISQAPEPLSYWQQIQYSTSVPNVVSFLNDTNVTLTLRSLFGFLFTYEPTTPLQLILKLTENGSFYEYEENSYCSMCTPTVYTNPAFPWYFAQGTVLDLKVSTVPRVGYWNGTGNGSFTGYANETNITVGGPIHETAWALSDGSTTRASFPRGSRPPPKWRSRSTARPIRRPAISA